MMLRSLTSIKARRALKLLGLEPRSDLTLRDVRSAYRERVLRLHPDVLASSSSGGGLEAFQLLQEAHDTVVAVLPRHVGADSGARARLEWGAELQRLAATHASSNGQRAVDVVSAKVTEEARVASLIKAALEGLNKLISRTSHSPSGSTWEMDNSSAVDSRSGFCIDDDADGAGVLVAERLIWLLATLKSLTPERLALLRSAARGASSIEESDAVAAAAALASLQQQQQQQHGAPGPFLFVDRIVRLTHDVAQHDSSSSTELCLGLFGDPPPCATQVLAKLMAFEWRCAATSAARQAVAGAFLIASRQHIPSTAAIDIRTDSVRGALRFEEELQILHELESGLRALPPIDSSNSFFRPLQAIGKVSITITTAANATPGATSIASHSITPVTTLITARYEMRIVAPVPPSAELLMDRVAAAVDEVGSLVAEREQRLRSLLSVAQEVPLSGFIQAFVGCTVDEELRLWRAVVAVGRDPALQTLLSPGVPPLVLLVVRGGDGRCEFAVGDQGHFCVTISSSDLLEEPAEIDLHEDTAATSCQEARLVVAPAGPTAPPTPYDTGLTSLLADVCGLCLAQHYAEQLLRSVGCHYVVRGETSPHNFLTFAETFTRSTAARHELEHSLIATLYGRPPHIAAVPSTSILVARTKQAETSCSDFKDAPTALAASGFRLEVTEDETLCVLGGRLCVPFTCDIADVARFLQPWHSEPPLLPLP